MKKHYGKLKLASNIVLASFAVSLIRNFGGGILKLFQRKQSLREDLTPNIQALKRHSLRRRKK